MTAIALLEQQNRLLEEQNRLLRTLAESKASAINMAPEEGDRRMMTEYDLLLIVTADNVTGAVRRWNALAR